VTEDNSQPLFFLSEILGANAPVIDILDIGAMIEGDPRYASIYQAGHGRLTLVEPNKDEAARLEKAFTGEARYLDCFLGDGKPGVFHETFYPGCASMFEPDPDVIDKFISIGTGAGSNFEIIGKAEVETTRLDDISPVVAADYIKIDVQGSELRILENATKTLENVLVLETEAEFIAIYRDQPLFGDLQVFMRAQGFVFHKFIDVASRCFRPLYFDENITAGMSQMMWADCIFIRDFTDLAGYSEDGLLKAAYVMHNMYSSYDLVYVLLNEYDERCATVFANSYAKKLASFPHLPKFLLNMKEHSF